MLAKGSRKKNPPLMVRPLRERGGGGGKGRTIKEKKLFFFFFWLGKTND